MDALLLNILHASFLNNHNSKVLSCWNTLHIKGLEQLNSLRKMLNCILLGVLFVLNKTKLIVTVVSPAVAVTLMVWSYYIVLTQSNTLNKDFSIVKISIDAAWLSGPVIIQIILTQIILLFERIIWLLDFP